MTSNIVSDQNAVIGEKKIALLLDKLTSISKRKLKVCLDKLEIRENSNDSKQ